MFTVTMVKTAVYHGNSLPCHSLICKMDTKSLYDANE